MKQLNLDERQLLVSMIEAEIAKSHGNTPKIERLEKIQKLVGVHDVLCEVIGDALYDDLLTYFDLSIDANTRLTVSGKPSFNRPNGVHIQEIRINRPNVGEFLFYFDPLSNRGWLYIISKQEAYIVG